MAVTFAGVGSFHLQGQLRRMDDWLARELANAGIPELDPADLAACTSEEATKLFRAFGEPEPHTFVIAGFEYADGVKPRAFGLVVTNIEGTSNTQRTATTSFHVEPWFVPAKRNTGILITGMERALDRQGRRRMQRQLDRHHTVDSCEQTICDAVRTAATNPAASGTIGRDCMATSISSGRECRSTFYSEGLSPHSFGPTVAWTTPMGNAVASHIDALVGPGHRVSFAGGGAAFQLLVGKPNEDANGAAVPEKQTVSCKFSISKPKYGPGVEVGESEQIMTLITPQRVRKQQVKHHDETR